MKALTRDATAPATRPRRLGCQDGRWPNSRRMPCLHGRRPWRAHQARRSAPPTAAASDRRHGSPQRAPPAARSRMFWRDRASPSWAAGWWRCKTTGAVSCGILILNYDDEGRPEEPTLRPAPAVRCEQWLFAGHSGEAISLGSSRQPRDPAAVRYKGQLGKWNFRRPPKGRGASR